MSSQPYGDNFEHDTLSTCCHSMPWGFSFGQEKKPTVKIIRGTKTSPFFHSQEVPCNEHESEDTKQPAEVRDEECGVSHCFQVLINDEKAKLATEMLAKASGVIHSYQASPINLSEKEQAEHEIVEKEKVQKAMLGATRYNDTPGSHIVQAELVSRNAEVIPKIEVGTQTDPLQMMSSIENIITSADACSSTESSELSSDVQSYDNSSALVDECKAVLNSSFGVQSIVKTEYHFFKRLSLLLLILLAMITPCQLPAATDNRAFQNCTATALATSSIPASTLASDELPPTMHSYNTSLVPFSPFPAYMVPTTDPKCGKVEMITTASLPAWPKDTSIMVHPYFGGLPACKELMVLPLTPVLKCEATSFSNSYPPDFDGLLHVILIHRYLSGQDYHQCILSDHLQCSSEDDAAVSRCPLPKYDIEIELNLGFCCNKILVTLCQPIFGACGNVLMYEVSAFFILLSLFLAFFRCSRLNNISTIDACDQTLRFATCKTSAVSSQPRSFLPSSDDNHKCCCVEDSTPSPLPCAKNSTTDSQTLDSGFGSMGTQLSLNEYPQSKTSGISPRNSPSLTSVAVCSLLSAQYPGGDLVFSIPQNDPDEDDIRDEMANYASLPCFATEQPMTSFFGTAPVEASPQNRVIDREDDGELFDEAVSEEGSQLQLSSPPSLSNKSMDIIQDQSVVIVNEQTSSESDEDQIFENEPPQGVEFFGPLVSASNIYHEPSHPLQENDIHVTLEGSEALVGNAVTVEPSGLQELSSFGPAPPPEPPDIDIVINSDLQHFLHNYRASEPSLLPIFQEYPRPIQEAAHPLPGTSFLVGGMNITVPNQSVIVPSFHPKWYLKDMVT